MGPASPFSPCQSRIKVIQFLGKSWIITRGSGGARRPFDQSGGEVAAAGGREAALAFVALVAL